MKTELDLKIEVSKKKIYEYNMKRIDEECNLKKLEEEEEYREKKGRLLNGWALRRFSLRLSTNGPQRGGYSIRTGITTRK